MTITHFIARRLSIVVALLALLAAPVVAMAGEHESEHYRLHTVGDRAEAEAGEMLAILEQAYKLYSRHFGGRTPGLGRDEKLDVVFTDTNAQFCEELKKRGLSPMDSGGYYDPNSKTAFAWRQPQDYDTRALLVHECAHQFHYLSCTNNRNPNANWYTEGIAEFLSNHLWDGQTLALPARPWVTPKNNLKKALDALRNGATVRAIVTGQVGSYAEWWALYRFFVTSPDRRIRKGFDEFAKAADNRQFSVELLERLFGDLDDLNTKFREWLESDQQDLIQVWGYWRQLRPDTLTGECSNIGMCRFVSPAVHTVAATLQPAMEGPWKAGIVIGFVDTKNFLMANVVNGRELSVVGWVNGRWMTAKTEALTLPAGKPVRIEARRAGDKVEIRINDGEPIAVDLPEVLRGQPMGFSGDACTPVFTGVSWQPGGPAGSAGPSPGPDGDDTPGSGPLSEAEVRRLLRQRIEPIDREDLPLREALAAVAGDLPVRIDDGAAERVDSIRVDAKIRRGTVESALEELIAGHNLELQVTPTGVTIVAVQVRFPRGSDQYERFMEVAATLLPRSHRALKADSVTEAVAALGDRNRDRMERLLRHLRRQADDDTLLRDLLDEFE